MLMFSQPFLLFWDGLIPEIAVLVCKQMIGWQIVSLHEFEHLAE